MFYLDELAYEGQRCYAHVNAIFSIKADCKSKLTGS